MHQNKEEEGILDETRQAWLKDEEDKKTDDRIVPFQEFIFKSRTTVNLSKLNLRFTAATPALPILEFRNRSVPQVSLCHDW